MIDDMTDTGVVDGARDVLSTAPERAQDVENAHDAASAVPTPPPARDEHGRFLPGNLAAVSHALRASQLPPEFAHLVADVDEFMAGCLVDEGDAHDIPTRRRSLLAYRARLHRRILQLDTAIETRGLFDRRGKMRLGWLQRLEGLIASAKGLDSLLGLARQAKRTQTLAEYLEQRSAAPATEGTAR